MHKKLPGYLSFRQVAVTLIFFLIPFIFLLIFSTAAHLKTLNLFADVGISLWRMLIAYVVAAGLGWLFAIVFYQGKRGSIALPIFEVLQSFPTFAALPLAVTYWGNSSSVIIIFLGLEIIWPVFFTTVSALEQVRNDWREAVKMSNLKVVNYLTKFLLPVSVPAFITGSIIGLGDSWQALIATEIIVAPKTGLGTFFARYAQNPTITVWAILGFLVIIFSINKLLWIPLLERSHKMMEE